jgi:hypothetical protein
MMGRWRNWRLEDMDCKIDVEQQGKREKLEHKVLPGVEGFAAGKGALSPFPVVPAAEDLPRKLCVIQE